MFRTEELDDAGRTNNTSQETNSAASATTNVAESIDEGRYE